MRQHTVQTPYMVGEAHCYSTEIDGNLVLFDTGPATHESLACLREHLDLSRLKYVFITHCHVDHYGLTATLAQQYGAVVLLPHKDAVKLRRHQERLTHIERILGECGFDAAFTSGFRNIVEKNKIFPDVPDDYAIVEESIIPAQLGVNWLSCPGHSQSDLVYCHDDWAVSGDILLRNIFQAPLLDVDLETFSGRFRNYDAYCDSLRKLATLRHYRIMPGHRYSLESVDDTILFYVRKMLERAGVVKNYASVEPIREVTDLMFRDVQTDPFFIYLKASEIVFMRDFLADPARLQQSLQAIDLYDNIRELFGNVAE